MDDEFEKWFASIGNETLNSRSLHANMERAWQMSRIMQHRQAPDAADSPLAPACDCGAWAYATHKKWCARNAATTQSHEKLI